MKVRLVDGVEVQRGSGNVFADLDLPDAVRLKIETGLVVEIRKAMRGLGLKERDAAERMGLTQAEISGLMRGEFTDLSGRDLRDRLARLIA